MNKSHWRINRKLSVQGLVVIGITIISVLVPSTSRFLHFILPVWGMAFFVFYYLSEQVHRPRPVADLVTGARLVFAILFFSSVGLGNPHPLLALAAIAILEAADGLDGWVARKSGSTEFGAVLDMESDAFVILLLAYAAVLFEGMPLWVLLPGLIRYLFFFPFMALKPSETEFPKLLSWYSKTICVATVFCLGSAWYLTSASIVAIAIVSVLLLASFLWEASFYISLRFQARMR